jgi:hypothetical protein
VPGFWDYPSGTVGDALLLPAIIGGLFVQSRRLKAYRPDAERRYQHAGFVLGAVGGAAVPLSWLLDSHTSPIWMLPRPHHFVLAGWWHLVFLTLATGFLALLIVTVFGRLRRAPKKTRDALPDGYSPAAMTLIVGAGLGMLVLIGRDAVEGGRTVASATTATSLLLVACIFLGGLAWATRGVTISRLWTPSAIVVVFLVGLVGVIVRWPPHVPGVLGLGAVSAVLVCVAATSPMVRRKHAEYRWLTVVAMASVLTAGLVRSVDAVFRDQSRPLLWLVAAVLIAFALLSFLDGPRSDLRRTIRYGFFVAYCLVMFYFAARLKLPSGEHAAGAEVSVADAAFDVMVFTLIQSRWGELPEGDWERVRIEYVGRPAHCQGLNQADDKAKAGPILRDTYLLGIAVALSLLVLLVLAAGPLGLERSTAAVPAERVVLLAGVVVGGLLLVVNEVLLDRWRKTRGEPLVGPKAPHDKPRITPDPPNDKLDLPGWYGIAPAATALAWAAAALILSHGTSHLAGFAFAVGLVVFVFALKTLLYTPILLQTLRPTVGQVILCTVTALSLAFVAFWFVSRGIWRDDAPLSGGWLAGTAVCVFFGTVFVYAASGLALSAGLPLGKRPTQFVLSRDDIRGYVGLDAAVLGIVFFIGVAIPLYAATREQAVHGPSLNVVAAMVLLPGLISAVVWGLRNWRAWEDLNEDAKRDQLNTMSRRMRSGYPRPARHHDGEYKKVALPILELEGGDWKAAWERDLLRAKRGRRQIQFNRYAVIVLMSCGFGYLAEVLLR